MALMPKEADMTTDNLFGEIISSNSRAQAIEDGVLVDVTETAREAGIKYPVALTSAVFEKYVTIPPGVTGQDVAGRLWDILWMFRVLAGRGGREMLYSLYVRNDNRRPKKVTLKAVCGPGDTAEPVVTIMLPWED